MAPAFSRRSISTASRFAGGRSRLMALPARVGRPLTSNRFLTAKGMPARGPVTCPASTASACANARSAVTSVKAFTTRSLSAMFASVASMVARAVMAQAWNTGAGSASSSSGNAMTAAPRR